MLYLLSIPVKDFGVAVTCMVLQVYLTSALLPSCVLCTSVARQNSNTHTHTYTFTHTHTNERNEVILMKDESFWEMSL